MFVHVATMLSTTIDDYLMTITNDGDEFLYADQNESIHSFYYLASNLLEVYIFTLKDKER